MTEDLSFPAAGFLSGRLVILTAALACFTIGFFPGASASDQDLLAEPGEKPLALVNGSPIYPSDLNRALEASHVRKPHLHVEPSIDVPGVLDRLIDVEILYQESLKHRFPGLVEETEEIFEREVRHAGGREKLRSTLACNGITLDRFRQSIFRNASIRRLLTEVVYPGITVSEEEIVEHYTGNLSEFRTPESVRLRQIFIRIPSFSDEDSLREMEDRARGIFRQAAEGKDFLSLARKYSDDPDSARNGGEMGVIFRGNLHRHFESLVFGVSEGSVTEPVRSTRGFHIFQVVAFFPSSPPPLEEVRSTIADRILRMKAGAEVSAFVSSLREKARIVIIDEKPLRGEDHEQPFRIRR